jgi:hypothetical protein
MEKVIIESPFSGDVEANLKYLNDCIRDCILNYNESPFASHLLYTKALNDDIEDERELGIQAGFKWRDTRTKTVFYIDRGFSKGMIEGLKDAIKKGGRIEIRSLGDSTF